jgi:hypothetical protein
MAHVYSLVCPIKQQPIYVGSTTKGVEVRLGQHICAIRKSELPLYKYLIDNCITPSINVLEEVSSDCVKKSEKKWIDELTKMGYGLLNKKKMITVGSGSIKIKSDIYLSVLEYCKKNGIKISFFATEAVREKIKSVKNQTE